MDINRLAKNVLKNIIEIIKRRFLSSIVNIEKLRKGNFLMLLEMRNTNLLQREKKCVRKLRKNIIRLLRRLQE